MYICILSYIITILHDYLLYHLNKKCIIVTMLHMYNIYIASYTKRYYISIYIYIEKLKW